MEALESVLKERLTQDAGLAQAGDGLSVVPAGEDGRRARAGDALGVGRRVLDRVQERGSDLVVRRGVGGAAPGRK